MTKIVNSSQNINKKLADQQGTFYACQDKASLDTVFCLLGQGPTEFPDSRRGKRVRTVSLIFFYE
jgi:hypothetical protein